MERIESVLGIDPGVHGSFALLRVSDGQLIETKNFPLIEQLKKNTRKFSKKPTRVERFYDRECLREDLEVCDSSVTVCYLEQAHSRPGEGAAMAFKFGDCYGQLKMILDCLDIKFLEVSPKAWCSEMHKGISGDNAKKRSREVFNRLFPSVKHRFSNLVPDGIVDACLIGEYGRRRIENDLDLWRFE